MGLRGGGERNKTGWIIYCRSLSHNEPQACGPATQTIDLITDQLAWPLSLVEPPLSESACQGDPQRGPYFTQGFDLLRWEVRPGSALRDLGRVCWLS